METFNNIQNFDELNKSEIAKRLSGKKEETNIIQQQLHKTTVECVPKEIVKRTSERKTTQPFGISGSTTLLKCGQCGERFTTKKKFYIHLRIHGPLPYSCQYCWKSFPSFQGLRKHVVGVCQKKRPVTGNTTTTTTANEAPPNNSADRGILRHKPRADSHP